MRSAPFDRPSVIHASRKHAAECARTEPTPLPSDAMPADRAGNNDPRTPQERSGIVLYGKRLRLADVRDGFNLAQRALWQRLDRDAGPGRATGEIALVDLVEFLEVGHVV